MQENIELATEVVLEFLKEIPLSSCTVKYYRSCYRTINRYCQINCINRFSDNDAADFSKHQIIRHKNGEISLVYALILRKAAAMLADYMCGKELVWERRNYSQKCLYTYYEGALIEFESYLTKVLAPGSVRLIKQVVRQFLCFLEDSRIFDFKAIKPEDVKRFVIKVSPRYKSSMVNLTWPVKKFMTFLGSAGYTTIDVEKLIGSPVPKRTRVLPCFTDEESHALLSAVDTSTPLGKRDYAIMKIAIGVGLRGEDIFRLRLPDIDWRKNEISIVQSKTSGHIVLPLMPDVGNAVADYILNARPQSDSSYVFLRHRKPHNWLGDGPTGALIIERYRRNAGISHAPGNGKTFHAFRRTVGTRLIKAEVTLASTAQILGHKRIDSTKRYIAMNDDMLRVCCMDISDYATSKEGLA